MKKFFIILFFLICSCAYSQTLTNPSNYSLTSIIDWVQRGAFIASDSAQPSSEIATGALYVDLTTEGKPELWRSNGTDWNKFSFSGAADLDFTAGTVTASSASLLDLQVYEDNSEATTGGLSVGDVYRTASGALMIVYEE